MTWRKWVAVRRVECVLHVWERCVGVLCGLCPYRGSKASLHTQDQPLSQPWHPAGVCQLKTASKAETIEEEDKRHKGVCVKRGSEVCDGEMARWMCVRVGCPGEQNEPTQIPEDYMKVSRRHSEDIWKTGATSGRCSVGVGTDRLHLSTTHKDSVEVFYHSDCFRTPSWSWSQACGKTFWRVLIIIIFEVFCPTIKNGRTRKGECYLCHVSLIIETWHSAHIQRETATPFITLRNMSLFSSHAVSKPWMTLQ